MMTPRKVSATNTINTVSGPDAVIARLKAQSNVKNATEGTVYKGLPDILSTFDKGASQAKASSAATPPTDTNNKQPQATKFNLPPHEWSLPLRPIEMDSDHGGKTRFVGGADYEHFHGMRRGRIWFYNTYDSVSKLDENGSAVTVKSASPLNSALTGIDAKKITTYQGPNVKDYENTTPTQQPVTIYKGPNLAAYGVNTSATPASTNQPQAVNLPDRDYGFQFLWNPTDISVSVDRNMDVTPSPADRLRAVAGAFPGMESVSFSIVLDRTNDFACAKGMAGFGASFYDMYSAMAKYYKAVYPNNVIDNKKDYMNKTISDIKNLLEMGTMADLEYLFKAINGGSIGGTSWKTYNLLGKETTDIGYLQPTLLAFQLGAELQGSLSYVGWISNLSMNHTAFTETMIPIRTQVNFKVDCFAGSALTAK